MNKPDLRLEPGERETPDLSPARADAPRAPAHYLRTAVAEIDAVFGPGYAAQNPQLVASLVQASAIDAAVAAGEAAHAEALDAAYKISREMGETILKLKPRLFG